MKPQPAIYFFLPGSGNGSPELSVLKANADDDVRFESIVYPGWRRYIARDFTADRLIDELATAIEKKAPEGPLRLVGSSMGGHFGYAVALRLLSRGREVAGLCAIDSFMVVTAAPTAGWQRRVMHDAIGLLRSLKFGKLIRFVSTMFWRAALRSVEGRLSALLNRFSTKSWIASLMALNPSLERELSLRLLVRNVVPWLVELDKNPMKLTAPSVLIRTPSNVADDAAWRRRCPDIQIREIPGGHHTLFEPENVAPLREAFCQATAEWEMNYRTSKP